MAEIKKRLGEVKQRMAAAARRAGRGPDEIQLVAISKGIPLPQIREGLEAGIPILGENRVQEAREKIAVLGRPVSWHMVGHLQTNKAKLAVELFDLIHSLDSLRLARELDRHGQAAGKVVRAFVQVKLVPEETKSGVEEADFFSLVEATSELSNLKVEGLMVLPPFFRDPEESRPFFRRLRELRDHLRERAIPNVGMQHLSMGMSHDFEVAIEEGATLVRIGTAIFGPRPTG
ncbi:MAG: YggS family pyridoxal phosphate-dependent enzyme [candidate division NC10 bacterium]|nr:YggS family pyridoxal phosphate-dependent enzyme [candidate division NC10 bacterium]